MSLVFKSKTEMCSIVFSIFKLLQQKWKKMCSSFFILKLYQRERNRVRFILPYLNFHNHWSLPYHVLVFNSKIEMWSVNFINIIDILITKTVCSSLLFYFWKNWLRLCRLQHYSLHWPFTVQVRIYIYKLES